MLHADNEPEPTDFYYRRAGFDDCLEYGHTHAPWRGYGEFGQLMGESGSGHPKARLYYIYKLLKQSLAVCPEGEVWEAGVFQGSSASFLARCLKDRPNTLRLFDTFGGMPETDAERDAHRAGDFADTSLERVKSRINAIRSERVEFHPGVVPQTFAGLEDKSIAFAHIDLDIYHPIKASCELLWPRLRPGAAMVFDDYAWKSCIGAKQAVDEFFADRPEEPITLPTGQGFVVKAQ